MSEHFSEETPAPEQAETTEEPFQIDPTEWNEVRDTMSLIRDAMSQPEPQQYQQQGPQNPMAEYFGDELANAMDQYFESKLAPLNNFTEEASYAEAEERAQDIISSLASEKGDLPEGANALVRSIANDFIADAQERYGFGPQAAEAALAEAYDHVQGLFNTANQQYWDTKMNEMETRGRVRPEPDVGAPVAQGLERTKGDEMALVRSFFPNK